MRKEIQSSWMISPKSLISLLGAEYHLMKDAGVLKRFYISSILIVTILALTCVSIFYALDLLFHKFAIEATLAVFFCLLFFCIYTFLLNTFAKENRKQKSLLSLSNIIRISFVAFMGFLIAQPIIILIFSEKLSHEVNLHKQRVLAAHTTMINNLMSEEVNKLAGDLKKYQQQKVLFDTDIYDRSINKIQQDLRTLNAEVNLLHVSARQTIDQNSFFLYRIQTVVRKYPVSWIFTFLIVLLTLLPGYLIYSISSQHVYYVLKKSEEKKVIVSGYNMFLSRYREMFIDQLTYFSRYEDPPFNTVRKQAPSLASTKDFLQKYLHDG